MRDKLIELKSRTAVFLDILPLLEAVITRLTKNDHQETSHRSPSDHALFSFNISLDPTQEDGSMFACGTNHPDCGHGLTLAESLGHLRNQIETFESLIGSLGRLGLELEPLMQDAAGTGCSFRRVAKLNGHTLELVLTVEDAIYVRIDFIDPDGQELWIDAEDEVWRIETDNWSEDCPLDELTGDATSEPGSVNYSREGVLEALVDRMSNPVDNSGTKAKAKTRRRRKLRRYAVD